MPNKLSSIVLVLFLVLLILTLGLVFLYLRESKTDLTLPTQSAQQIWLESDVKGVLINWKDKKGFEQYLESLDFWNSNGVINLHANQKITAKSLVIRLSENPEDIFYRVTDKQGNIWDSIEQKIDEDGNVEIIIYRKDWKEDVVNLRVNQAIWKITKGERGALKGQSLFEDSGVDPLNPKIFLNIFRK